MADKAIAYLDGGPASGLTVELDTPDWAPIAALRIEVEDIEVVYVRAPQRPPPRGYPWRYIPQGSAEDVTSAEEDEGVGPDQSDD